MLALVAVVVLGVSVVLLRGPSPSTYDVATLEESMRLGCPGGDPRRAEPAFLFVGQVTGVTGVPDGGALVDFVVEQWFAGPPLRQVDTLLSATDLSLLRGAGLVEPGARVVVRGAAWSADGSPPPVSCGDVVRWGSDLAADLRRRYPASPDLAFDGPLALYPTVGFSRTAPLSTPVLIGVLTVYNGCVHVKDGSTEWLVRFPAAESSWDSATRSVRFDSHDLATGTTVRLAGSPADGLVPRRGQALTPTPADDARGGSAGPCGQAPEFVVAVPPDGEVTVEDVTGSPSLDQVSQVLADANVEVSGLQARSRTGSFDGTSLEVDVQLPPGSGLGSSLNVRTDSARPRTWPAAYLDDELFASEVGPRGCVLTDLDGDGDVDGHYGDSVVQRAEDVTRLVLRAPGGRVALVTVDTAIPGNDLCVLRNVAATMVGS